MRIARLMCFLLLATVSIRAGDAPRPAGFPSRPIEIIVPFAAGGGMDRCMRLVASHVEKELGQSVQVRNLTAGGNIQGNRAGIDAAPDGHVWGSWGMGLVTDELLVRNATYTHRDVIPVAMVAMDPHIIAINAQFADQNNIIDLAGLLRHIVANPGQVVFGAGGNWTAHDFVRLKIEQAAGAKFARMPFLGGALATEATANGNCDVASPFGPEYLPFESDSRLIALAVANTSRLKFLPGVPSTAESGQPELVQVMWRVISVPKQTPQPIVDYIATVLRKTLHNPEFIQEMQSAGLNPAFLAGQELAEFIEEEFQYFEKQTESWGIRVER